MRTSFVAIIIVIFSQVGALSAQQACPLPPVLQLLPHEQNMFSDQQESDLGDILSDSLIADEDVVEDDALSSHLRQLAGQLVRYLPENHFRLQFYLIEIPEANAYSLPGGRIYVTRKLIANLKTDDELAAVLAHELGHALTHQSAILTTQLFRQILGVNAVTDRADIADKIHRMRETWAMHKVHIKDSEVANELPADQVSLYAMARAGFKLQSFADALDRTADLHRKTGNWITDFFRTTKPEQKRLREAINSIGAMPSVCIAPVSHTRDDGFTEWQSQVIAFKQPAGHENLTEVVLREKLTQPLRPTISNIRFSPDGNYILAQDDGGIHVLSRDPLKDLFFIETNDSYKPFFTADSKSILFRTGASRLEQWDLTTHKRILVREMVLHTSCVQSMLAPDGKTLACYDPDGNLWLIETATGNQIFERKNFFHPTKFGAFLINYAAAIDTNIAEAANSSSEAPFLYVNLGFSPNAKYFVAGSVLLAGDETRTFAYDLVQRREIPLNHGVRDAIQGQFVFLGNDRIAAVDLKRPAKSPVIRFPSGEKIEELPLDAETHLTASAAGDYLMAGPVKGFALSLISVEKKTSVARVKFDAADIDNGTLVFEQTDGSLALMDLASSKIAASLALQNSWLSSSSVVAISPDFKWLATSTRTRGAIWDLTSNTRTHSMRAFRSGWFADAHAFYADFPKFGDQERAIVKLDPAGSASPARMVYALGKLMADQMGSFVLISTPEKNGSNKNWGYELHDCATKGTIWSHKFANEYPHSAWDVQSGKVLFQWSTRESAAREELKQYPELKAKAENSDYFFELLDFRKDKVIAKLLLKTNKGSFSVRDIAFDGDWLAVTTDDGVAIYSFNSGSEIGHVFGYLPYLSAEAGVFVVTQSDTVLDLYDLSTTALRKHYKFNAPVIAREFSADGKRLFVLTSDQTVYILDLSASSVLSSKIVSK